MFYSLHPIYIKILFSGEMMCLHSAIPLGKTRHFNSMIYGLRLVKTNSQMLDVFEYVHMFNYSKTAGILQ